MRRFAIACAVLVLAAGVQASTIEDTTGILYQHDGGTEGDASDDCADPSPEVQPGTDTTGLLVAVLEGGAVAGNPPVDDVEDNYALPVGPGLVGGNVTVVVDPAPNVTDQTPAPNYDLLVWSPGCEEVVAESHARGSGPDEVVFEPQVEGTYTVQVVPGDAAPVDGPVQGNCHPTCIVAVNTFLGYGLNVGSG